MPGIKRVLWVDDIPDNKVRSLFSPIETRQVSTMEEAIDEMSGEHLYDYDTIVFDIDFENGLPHGEKKVVEKLAKKIFLSKDQRGDVKFLIRNGGYLLYLYLLEKGYPSEQVAFLTGNPTIVNQLRIYTEQNTARLSKDEIADGFLKAWQDSKGDIIRFGEIVEELPVNINYKDSDLVLDCAQALFSGDEDKVRELIGDVVPSMVTGSIDNTGDKMIYRFHESNLESPVYFSKNDNDIDGHNCRDAEKWLRSRRTEDNVARWLLLDAADRIESLYRQDGSGMNSSAADLFENDGADPGIRSAFRQMFFVFDGRIDTSRRGVFYQAVSAMLIPFDADIRNGGPSAKNAFSQYFRLRRTFARVLKQARNYTAHNAFGSQLSNGTVLFLIGASLLALLEKDDARSMEGWFKGMYREVSKGTSFTPQDCRTKTEELCRMLIEDGKIDTFSAHVSSDWNAYTPLDLVRALGFNTDMSPSMMKSSRTREDYYLFTLAAYLTRWFDGLSEEEVASRFGNSAAVMYRLACEIVSSYRYPSGDIR